MDRFFRGFIAGFIGGVAMNIWTLIAVFILNLQIIRFIDWASVFLYGSLPQNHIQGIFALWMQLIWSGLLGVAFAFLLPQITSRGYLLKGAIFGVVAGFLMYALPTLFQTPIVSSVSFETTVSNHAGGLLWGLTTAQSLRWLDKKVPVK
ncbi:MAG: hypothetical protein KGZ79_12195 [Dethiobacter sp.]|jgi:hypothetical protein|nr:hypothetical protein [Dethiobacter sp.]